MSDTENSIDPPNPPPWFAAKLAEAQPSLYSWACVMLGHARDAWDVVQNSNKVMLEKATEVQSPEGFMRWAYVVVQFEVMAYTKTACRQRRRHIADQSVLERIATQASQTLAAEDRIATLEDCLEELSERLRQCVAMRYEGKLPLKAVAARLNRSENTVAAMLYRARRALAECIERKRAEGDHS
jgi:RNA polymerase sigma-70 factor, ECF subfamily